MWYLRTIFGSTCLKCLFWARTHVAASHQKRNNKPKSCWQWAPSNPDCCAPWNTVFKERISTQKCLNRVIWVMLSLAPFFTQPLGRCPFIIHKTRYLVYQSSQTVWEHDKHYISRLIFRIHERCWFWLFYIHHHRCQKHRHQFSSHIIRRLILRWNSLVIHIDEKMCFDAFFGTGWMFVALEVLNSLRM